MGKARRGAAARCTEQHCRTGTGWLPAACGILPWAWALAVLVPITPGRLPAQDLPPITQPVNQASRAESPPGTLVPDQAAAPPFKVPSYDPNAGFRLVDPVDPNATPHELTFNLFFQPRYTGFSRADRAVTQANGQSVQVNNTSDFQLIRLVPEVSGHVFDPGLYYHALLFMTSTTNSATPLGFVGYRFSEEFAVEAAYWKLPVNREFNSPYHKMFGTDWSMATTFFRPGFVPGANINGTLFGTLRYKAGLYDAFTGPANNWNPSRTNTNLVYSHDLAWEPLGAFGPSFEDFAFSESPLVRLGSGFAAGRIIPDADDISGPNASAQNPNNTIFRLSDGTPVNAVGIVGPQLAVRAANLWYLTADAELKFRGFNIGAEYNFRLLNRFRTVTVERGGRQVEGGTPNRTHTFDHGGWLYAGYFLLPRQMMAYAKASLVTGPYGTGWEGGGGLAYYPFRNINTRLTLECLHLSQSPAQNVLTPYLWPGQTGTVVMAGASFYF